MSIRLNHPVVYYEWLISLLGRTVVGSALLLYIDFKVVNINRRLKSMPAEVSKTGGKKYVNLRVSDYMKQRINAAFDREGIDWTSLAKAYLYEFTRQVEADLEPNLVNQEYLKHDQQPKKDKYLQIVLNSSIKERFQEAAGKKNLTETAVILPYLIKLTLEFEQKYSD